MCFVFLVYTLLAFVDGVVDILREFQLFLRLSVLCGAVESCRSLP